MAAWSSEEPPMPSTRPCTTWCGAHVPARDVLPGEVQQRGQELCADMAEQDDTTMEDMEVSPDPV
jgi:hypothetical protein